MTAHDYPFILPPECDPACVECRDDSGRSLLVTSRPQRTGLTRAYAALIMQAPGRRVHLVHETPMNPEAEFPGLWSLAVCGPVRVGEAREDAVWRLLLASPYWRDLLGAGELSASAAKRSAKFFAKPFARPAVNRPVLTPLVRSVRVLSPDESAPFFPPQTHGRVETTLFAGRLSTLPVGFSGPAAQRRHREHIWLDPEEWQGFCTAFGDIVSPLAVLAANLLQSASPES